ncbi:hypothetical protein F2Q70_00031498 [Brassica cretica]|uniref:Uncharacterized protein n=1 Tax=Brassica cretica TaxID=69181 RepID=A0A8S9FM91_BRACR|nr:hypothetical protein F2Q70_00031498 [Brassica cretica]
MMAKRKRTGKAVDDEVVKPEEKAVNEGKEDFVSLSDLLDPEHDPQISRYARDLVEHVLYGDYRMEHRGCGD